jgi:hypothetical protein
MTGTADDGREDGTRSIISGETGLDHSGTVVNDKSLNVLIHLYVVWGVCGCEGGG